MADKTAVIEEQFKAAVAKYDAEVEAYAEYRDKEPQSTKELEEEAAMIENMKAHVNEYRRMQGLQSDVEILKEESELRRSASRRPVPIPGEILETAKIPIAGLNYSKTGFRLSMGCRCRTCQTGKSWISALMWRSEA